MKRIVLLTLVLAIVVSFCSAVFAAEVSVQRWQYYEQAVDEQLRSLQPTDTLYHSTPCYTHEEQERQEKLKNERNAVIDEVIALTQDGNEKFQQMIEKLILAGDERLIKKLLIDGEPKLAISPRLIKQLLARGNSQLVKHFCLRPATVEDYRQWLNGFLAKGGRISNFYDSPLEGSPHIKELWVAKKDFHLARLTGTDSIHVIIPKGVRYLGSTKNDQLGHNVFLTMDGYHQVGTAFMVATFSDTGFE